MSRGHPRPAHARRGSGSGDVRRRVLWLAKGLGLGGAERLLATMAGRLPTDRFDLTVAYLLPWKDAFAAEIEATGSTVRCLGARRTVDPVWVKRLSTLLRTGDFDLVHTHSPVPAAAARLLAPRGTSFVHTEHNVWERYARGTRFVNAATYHRNRHVFAVSDGVAASIAPPRWLPGTAPTVSTLLHGVVPEDAPRGVTSRAAARRALDLPPDSPVIGTVANFTPKKDQATLLDALDRLRHDLPSVVLCLVGSGPLEDELRGHVASSGLGPNVRFLGSRDDVPTLLPAFDVFALSSRYEGLPISILEAMAAEVAVVSTAVGGIPEALDDGVHGRLVDPGEPGALAAALLGVLTDPAHRSSLARAGRERVEQEFSIDRAVEATATLYDRLIAR